MAKAKVLLDSCIWAGAKQDLVSLGYDVKWVGDFLEDPGDEAIIELAFTEGRVLITLDKDFGELAVFRGKPHRGIIRMAGFSAVKQGQVSVQVLENYNAELEKSAIITVEKDRVRIRVPNS
jgi:predicted nuclease of predicted toxin-antitoxin system